MKPAPVPNISLVPKKTTNAPSSVRIAATVRVRARILSASFW